MCVRMAARRRAIDTRPGRARIVSRASRACGVGEAACPLRPGGRRHAPRQEVARSPAVDAPSRPVAVEHGRMRIRTDRSVGAEHLCVLSHGARAQPSPRLGVRSLADSAPSLPCDVRFPAVRDPSPPRGVRSGLCGVRSGLCGVRSGLCGVAACAFAAGAPLCALAATPFRHAHPVCSRHLHRVFPWACGGRRRLRAVPCGPFLGAARRRVVCRPLRRVRTRRRSVCRRARRVRRRRRGVWRTVCAVCRALRAVPCRARGVCRALRAVPCRARSVCRAFRRVSCR